jgi:hypothetical protein
VLIDEFLVVGDDCLSNCLTDGVDLGSVATTGNAHADVDFGEAVEAEEDDRLVDLLRTVSFTDLLRFYIRPSHCSWRELVVLSYLESEDLGLDETERLAVDLDETFALL